jgi:hypothetical protein
MKHYKNYLLLLILSSFYSTTLQAQNTVPSTGGNATGSGGSATFTIGQITYKMFEGTNGTIAQGVQQPYEILVVTALEEAKDINLNCSVYPNPTSDYLRLRVGDYENKNLSYWLYRVNGNLIEVQKIISIETQIDMGNRVAGTYFLKVISGNMELITFKIIKN